MFALKQSSVEETSHSSLKKFPTVKVAQSTRRERYQLRALHNISTPETSHDEDWYPGLKRFGDIIVSLGMFLALLPVMLIVGAIVKFTSPGPVIFRQRRLTHGRKEFSLYKFRTMREDAEALSGPVWASEKDPRITPVGQFLRKTRLDELPQLFNVLTGDMSLIGPRPERPEMAVEIEKSVRQFGKRLQVRAGLTGLAQIDAGYASNMEGHRKKLAYDLVYIQRQSLMLDLQILLRTVLVVVTGKGAR